MKTSSLETMTTNGLTKRITNGFASHKFQNGNHHHQQNKVLDKDTTLLTFEVGNAKTEVQVLYIVPQDGSTPFFGFSPSLISRLHTPHNLQYSEDKPALLKRADEFHLIRKYRCVPVQASQVMSSRSRDWSVKRVRTELLSFLEKYYLKTSLPFRFPRLVGMKAYLGVLLISFIAKLIYGLSSTPHAQNFTYFFGGDAQFHRHWQEVTNALPASHWYIESPLNPDHCHLDYPLITGYFHWFIGKYVTGYFVPAAILPSTIDLWGQPIEKFVNDQAHRLRLQSSFYYRSFKYFFVQRVSFVLFDTLFYGLSTLFLTSFIWRKINPRLQFCASLLVLLTPLDIHVDHSNPQVNFVPLAFFLIATRFALTSHYALSACFATLSLLSKVTVACILPPFVIIVLAKLFQNKDMKPLAKLFFLIKLTATVLAVFLVVNYPLLKSRTFSSMLNKIFPFSRGLPGQLIPTFWNTVHRIHHIHWIQPYSRLGKILRIVSQSLSVGGCIPPLIAVYQRPTIRRFMMSFSLCTLSFFQFNYYFHEKALLFFIIPLHLTIFETPAITILIANLLCVSSVRYLIKESEIEGLFYCLIIFTILLTKLYSQFPLNIQRQKAIFNSKIGIFTLIFVIIAIIIVQVLQNIYYIRQTMNFVIALFLLLYVPFILLWVDLMQRMFHTDPEERSLQTVQ